MCLHADQVRSLLHAGEGDPPAWRLVPRRRRLPVPYPAGIAAGIVVAVVLPHCEELRRCRRVAKARKRSRARITGVRTSRAAQVGFRPARCP
jgi:hypothetical protein